MCVIRGQNALRCSPSFTHIDSTPMPSAGDGRFIALPQLKAISPWTHIIHNNSGAFTKVKMLSEECSRGLDLLFRKPVWGSSLTISSFSFVLGINEHTVPYSIILKVLPGLRMNKRYSIKYLKSKII